MIDFGDLMILVREIFELPGKNFFAQPSSIVYTCAQFGAQGVHIKKSADN